MMSRSLAHFVPVDKQKDIVLKRWKSCRNNCFRQFEIYLLLARKAAVLYYGLRDLYDVQVHIR